MAIEKILIKSGEEIKSMLIRKVNEIIEAISDIYRGTEALHDRVNTVLQTLHVKQWEQLFDRVTKLESTRQKDFVYTQNLLNYENRLKDLEIRSTPDCGHCRPGDVMNSIEKRLHNLETQQLPLITSEALQGLLKRVRDLETQPFGLLNSTTLQDIVNRVKQLENLATTYSSPQNLQKRINGLMHEYNKRLQDLEQFHLKGCQLCLPENAFKKQEGQLKDLQSEIAGVRLHDNVARDNIKESISYLQKQISQMDKHINSIIDIMNKDIEKINKLEKHAHLHLKEFLIEPGKMYLVSDSEKVCTCKWVRRPGHPDWYARSHVVTGDCPVHNS